MLMTSNSRCGSVSVSVQPLHVSCPVCHSEGYYIQSVYVLSAIPDSRNILFSQYVCTNSHEWLIGQEAVGGPVLGRIRLK